MVILFITKSTLLTLDHGYAVTTRIAKGPGDRSTAEHGPHATMVTSFRANQALSTRAVRDLVLIAIQLDEEARNPPAIIREPVVLNLSDIARPPVGTQRKDALIRGQWNTYVRWEGEFL
ncbi:uncharacterized protein BCR38DRAFT_412139 [Pseudomassariella vexata]|uniref:Uncharacterized protein n=1 Tax=Pseudomassariella vexata TaxID=1141098 RepID=A0A1Y2DLA8_9PEZI|nr:uncharacterized protein BCR38DRAFT_412139 [Pseudomassariella vexata]ORY59916.1 hypothetical protein BCR38DRAFT_412139 [Pseudomassariella vexata]